MGEYQTISWIKYLRIFSRFFGSTSVRLILWNIPRGIVFGSGQRSTGLENEYSAGTLRCLLAFCAPLTTGSMEGGSNCRQGLSAVERASLRQSSPSTMSWKEDRTSDTFCST